MQTRWGSCNVERRNINLNLELIKKPRYCIEYVILHELAHLKYPNHGKKFWEYMSVHMPNWEWRKNKLESINQILREKVNKSFRVNVQVIKH